MNDIFQMLQQFYSAERKRNEQGMRQALNNLTMVAYLEGLADPADMAFTDSGSAER